MLCLRIKRKLNVEGAALTGNASHGNGTLMVCDYLFDDGQPQTAAASLAGA